jgi:aminopeptidase N
MMKLLLSFILLICSSVLVNSQTKPFDAISYDAEITPVLETKSVTGKVIIQLKSQQPNLSEITLDSGSLEIDSVRENQNALRFLKENKFLTIRFLHSLKINEIRKVEIAYHGTPKFGVSFFPEQNQVYTIFSTDQWMPCVMRNFV